MTTDPLTLFQMDNRPAPVLPYGGTSGWSGSETSRDRAITADTSGQTTERQQRVLSLLRRAGQYGMTWKELGEETGWHHGTASGALSVLHKAGKIERLSQTRLRSQIYVMPENVQGRQTQDYRPNVGARLLVEILEEIETDLQAGQVGKVLTRLKATREMFQ